MFYSNIFIFNEVFFVAWRRYWALKTLLAKNRTKKKLNLVYACYLFWKITKFGNEITFYWYEYLFFELFYSFFDVSASKSCYFSSPLLKGVLLRSAYCIITSSINNNKKKEYYVSKIFFFFFQKLNQFCKEFFWEGSKFMNIIYEISSGFFLFKRFSLFQFTL